MARRPVHVPWANGGITSPEKLNLVQICVRGKRFLIERKYLLRKPGTRLYNAITKASEENANTGHTQEMLFYNRNAAIFESILDYYVTGELHMPSNICWESFQKEITFWQVGRPELALCCQNHVVTDEQSQCYKMAQKVKREIRSKNESLLLLRKEGVGISLWEKCRLVLEEPSSCILARMLQLLTLFVVTCSFVILTISVQPSLRTPIIWQPLITNTSYSSYGEKMAHLLRTRPMLYLLEVDCGFLFYLTCLLVVKFVFTENKGRFLRSVMNWLELVSLMPMWIYSFMRTYAMMNIINTEYRKVMFMLSLGQILRVVYLIRMLEHLEGFKLILLAIKQSSHYLALLAMLIGVASIMFGHLYYFAEVLYDNADNMPQCVWWAFITLTTVGYGDIYPMNVAGYCIGVLCTFCGLVLFAIIIPVVANNFTDICNCLFLQNRMVERFQNKESKM